MATKITITGNIRSVKFVWELERDERITVTATEKDRRAANYGEECGQDYIASMRSGILSIETPACPNCHPTHNRIKV